jgi:hypothetical protein
MGVLHFKLPATLPPGADAALARARFVGGYDRTPFPTTLRSAGHDLEMAHDLTESGYLQVPWPVDGIGCPVTISATLREQSAPYRLLTELARGKLNSIRNAAEDWKLAGLAIPVDIVQKMEKALLAFGEAVVDPDAPAAEAKAEESLGHAYKAADSLAQLYLNTTQNLNRGGRISPRWTCTLTNALSTDESDLYLAAFDVVQYAPRWNRIESSPSKFDWSDIDAVVEWAAKQGRTMILGPIIDLAADTLPAWLNADDGDVPTMAAYLCDFVETIVRRYRDRVRDWVLCTGFNYTDARNLTQDDRLRLVVRLLEAARTADGECRFTIGVNQPWGEYLDQPEQTLSPLVFCDTLLRTGLSVSGFNLEILADASPRGSQYRDGLEVIRLFELYGLLGVPIDITLAHPGRAGNETVAQIPIPNPFHRGSDSTDAQADWGGLTAGLASTMPHVRTIGWNTWKDADSLATGLLATDAQPKPILFRLRHLHTEQSA